MKVNMRTVATLIYIIALSNVPSIFAEETYPQTFNIKDPSHRIQATNDLVVENEQPFKRTSRHAFGGYGIDDEYPYVGEKAALPSKLIIFHLIV